jgi:hypothetical protein
LVHDFYCSLLSSVDPLFLTLSRFSSRCLDRTCMGHNVEVDVSLLLLCTRIPSAPLSIVGLLAGFVSGLRCPSCSGPSTVMCSPVILLLCVDVCSGLLALPLIVYGRDVGLDPVSEYTLTSVCVYDASTARYLTYRRCLPTTSVFLVSFCDIVVLLLSYYCLVVVLLLSYYFLFFALYFVYLCFPFSFCVLLLGRR